MGIYPCCSQYKMAMLRYVDIFWIMEQTSIPGTKMEGTTKQLCCINEFHDIDLLKLSFFFFFHHSSPELSLIVNVDNCIRGCYLAVREGLERVRRVMAKVKFERVNTQGQLAPLRQSSHFQNGVKWEKNTLKYPSYKNLANNIHIQSFEGCLVFSTGFFPMSDLSPHFQVGSNNYKTCFQKAFSCLKGH